jgi:flagellin-like hook-associated protein FlgL
MCNAVPQTLLNTDADFVIEVANRALTKILRPSGLTVLTQANAVPRNVLALLGG